MKDTSKYGVFFIMLDRAPRSTAGRSDACPEERRPAELVEATSGFKPACRQAGRLGRTIELSSTINKHSRSGDVCLLSRRRRVVGLGRFFTLYINLELHIFERLAVAFFLFEGLLILKVKVL